jgi:hypothetical protein
MPDDAEIGLPTSDHALANLENAALKIGSPVTITLDQDDSIHLQVHFSVVLEAINLSLQGQGDVSGNFVFAQNAAKHITDHINKAREMGNKDLVKEAEKNLKIVETGMKKLQALLKQQAEDQAKQQQAQAVQNQTDPETQIKIAEAQQDMAIAQAKAEQELKIKAQNAQLDQAIKQKQLQTTQ